MVEYFNLRIKKDSKFIKISGGQGRPVALISTLESGDMGYSETRNYRKSQLCEDLKVNEKRLFQIKQLHSMKVHHVNIQDYGLDIRGDGLITNDRNCILAVTVADCLPIFIYDKKSGSFSLLHSGWKGTGIGLSALKMIIKKTKTRPENVEIIMGPSIGSCCYSVDRERAGIFLNKWGQDSVIRRDNDFFIDLKEANRNMFINMGVKNIKIAGNCTYCSPFLGSFRRQGSDSFTRMLAIYGYLDI